MEKPGYKTTEFWLSLAVVLIGALMASGAVGPDHWATQAAGALMAVLKALGYDNARAKVKFGEAQKAAMLGDSGAKADTKKRPSKRGR